MGLIVLAALDCVCVCLCVWLSVCVSMRVVVSLLLNTLCHIIAGGKDTLSPILQGGQDSQDALSCRSFFAKEPLIIGLFCGK